MPRVTASMFSSGKITNKPAWTTGGCPPTKNLPAFIARLVKTRVICKSQ